MIYKKRGQSYLWQQPRHFLSIANRGRWGTVDTFSLFQPLLLYFKSKQAQNLSHMKQLYIHNIMPKYENDALQKNFTINLKRVLFLSSVPHAWDTLE